MPWLRHQKKNKSPLLDLCEGNPLVITGFPSQRPVTQSFDVLFDLRVSPRDLTYSYKPECIGTTNPDRSVLITIISWHFQFHPVSISNLHVKKTYVLEARAVSRAPPIVTSRGPLNDGNCRLTTPVVKGRCAREALPHACNIGVFKYGKSNPTTMKHIYNESENLNESYDIAFDSNNWWNLP